MVIRWLRLHRLYLTAVFPNLIQLPLHWECVSYMSGRGCGDLFLRDGREASVSHAVVTLSKRWWTFPVDQTPIGRLDGAEVAGPAMMPSSEIHPRLCRHRQG